jgi:hypothetical protein
MAGILTEDDDAMDTGRDSYVDGEIQKIVQIIDDMVDSPELEGKMSRSSIIDMVKKHYEGHQKNEGMEETPAHGSKFAGLTAEEKEQVKEYINAIKETQKAMMEILHKSKKMKNEDGRWGGPRKNMYLDPNK